MDIVTLCYGEKGDYLIDWYLAGDRDDWAPDDWEPNVVWTSVRLERPDVGAFLTAERLWLRAAWTPNQGFGHGKCGYDGHDDRLKAQTIIDSLVVV